MVIYIKNTKENQEKLFNIGFKRGDGHTSVKNLNFTDIWIDEEGLRRKAFYTGGNLTKNIDEFCEKYKPNLKDQLIKIKKDAETIFNKSGRKEGWPITYDLVKKIKNLNLEKLEE